MTIHSMHAPEPSLPEMLADPIVRALMASDGVKAGALEELVESATNRLGDREAAATACCGRCGRNTSHGRTPGR